MKIHQQRFIKTIFLSAIFTLIVNSSSFAESIEHDSSIIQQAVNKMVEDKMLVGVAIGLYDKGDIEYIYSGYRTAHQAYPVDENTRFEIGSVTKTFVGTLLANAHANEGLDFNSPISDVLPNFNGHDKLSKISLRQLSSHSSGLPRLPTNMAPKNQNDPYADYTKEDLYQFLENFDDYKETDKDVVYSNLAVGLLGHLLALNSNTSFENLLEQIIFSPLGMNNSYVSTLDAALTELALPHTNDMSPVRPWRFDVLAPAGGISSTLPDMMKYLIANINTQTDPASVEDGSLRKAMQLSHKANYRFNDEDIKIGLGWLERQTSKGPVIWHNGATAGSSSFVGFNPNTKKGIVVLMNISAQATEAGFAYLEGNIESHLARYTAPVEKIVNAEDLAKLVGNYQLAPNFVLTVTQQDDRLFVQATGQQNIEVFPKSKTRFFYKVVEAEIEFDLDKKGVAKSLTLFQNGRELTGKKQ